MVGTFYEVIKAKPDIRLVVFAPPKTIADMKELFASERCIIEPLITERPKGFLANVFFGSMASYPLIPTKTIFIRQRYAYLNGGSFLGFVFKRTLWILGHFSFARQFFRWLWYKMFSGDEDWGRYFDKYSPDVVFSTSGFRWWDFTILTQAKRRRIPTILMLRSWDNLSTKAFLFVHPDLLLVQNPVMVDEAVRWHDVPPEKIRLVGSPPYDQYFDPSWKMSRREVAEKIGIDPQKRWIGYFSGPLLTGILECEDRGEHIDMIQKAIARGEIKNAEVIASMHPDNISVLEENKIKCKVLNLVKGWKFDTEQTKLLVNFIRECAVMTHFGSTIALDGAIADTPTIMIGFNGYNHEKYPWQKSLSVAFDQTLHMQYLLRTGGMARVNNEEELISAINRYFNNRSLDREGRKRAVRDLVGPLDGLVGKRILDSLLLVTK